MLIVALLVLFFVLPIVLSISAEMLRTMKADKSEYTGNAQPSVDNDSSSDSTISHGILHLADLDQQDTHSSKSVTIDNVAGDSFVRSDIYPPQRPDFY